MSEPTDDLSELDYLLDIWSETLTSSMARRLVRGAFRFLCVGGAHARIEPTESGMRAVVELATGETITLRLERLPDDWSGPDDFTIVLCWPDLVILESADSLFLVTTDDCYCMQTYEIFIDGASLRWDAGQGWTMRVWSGSPRDAMQRFDSVMQHLLSRPGGYPRHWQSTADFLDEMAAIGRFILTTKRCRPTAWLEAVLDVYDNHRKIPGYKKRLTPVSDRTLRDYSREAGYPDFGTMMDSLTHTDER